MTPQDKSIALAPRWIVAGEWLVVLGLLASVGWTTLCLGGYFAGTMLVTSWAVFGLASLGAVLWALGQGSQARTLHLAVLLPLPFLLYAFVSVHGRAPALWLAWREWLLWFQMWLVFALTLHLGRSHRQTWALIFGLAGLAVVGSCVAAYQGFVAPSWLMLGRTQLEQYLGRSSGMFGIPNSLAGLLELVIPVCLTLLSSRAVPPGGKLLAGWLAALFILGLALTGSRGGWIGLGAALLLWPMLAGRSWRRKVFGSAAVLLCVGGALLAFYRGSDYTQARLRLFLEGKAESSRPHMWSAGWRMWQDEPWLGQGTAAYQAKFEEYRPRGYHDGPLWAHNDYLNTLSDYGLVGFALWLGAGIGLAGVGWTAVRRARRETDSTKDLFARAKWKLGLFLGLLAFAFHLGVDFHTKIPALAMLAAILVALLVRDEPAWQRPVRGGPARLAALAVVAVTLTLGWRVASPLYRAEALRFDARYSIDRFSVTGRGNLPEIAVRARSKLAQAVRIDPTNGQAWADLAYATVQSWREGRDDLAGLGRFAELAADEALKRGPQNAEFWVRKAVALEVQRGRPETESCYLRALELAPNSRSTWYQYAYYLQAFPSRRPEALQALGTCLALDPHYPPANTLRQQLTTNR